MNYLMPRHKTWVLSRLAIEMTEMPKSYDRFVVETWCESAMKYFTSRDFKICGKTSSSEEAKVYGYGKSVWAMIDTETRQPVDILKFTTGSSKNILILKTLSYPGKFESENGQECQAGANH